MVYRFCLCEAPQEVLITVAVSVESVLS